MDKQNSMGQRIQELRKHKGLTQTELAKEIHVSMAAIRNYENNLREPNSKAMAALERYFGVSGEYLRGEVDRETFMQNSDAIQGQMDELVHLFQVFRPDLNCASQERQYLAISILNEVMRTISRDLLRRDGSANLDGAKVGRIFQAAFALNSDGLTELDKRAGEVTQLNQYKK